MLLDKSSELLLEHIANNLCQNDTVQKNLRSQIKEFEIKRKENLLEIISILDVLHQFKSNINDSTVHFNGDEESVFYEIIENKLISFLSKNEVKMIHFEEDSVNSEFVKVISTTYNPNKVDGSIYKIVENGYMIGNKILRKAAVILVKN